MLFCSFYNWTWFYDRSVILSKFHYKLKNFPKPFLNISTGALRENLAIEIRRRTNVHSLHSRGTNFRFNFHLKQRKRERGEIISKQPYMLRYFWSPPSNHVSIIKSHYTELHSNNKTIWNVSPSEKLGTFSKLVWRQIKVGSSFHWFWFWWLDVAWN